MSVYKTWGSKCPYCCGTRYEVDTTWEWRSMAFHCTIMCTRCYATIHRYGITRKRAERKAFKRLYERG